MDTENSDSRQVMIYFVNGEKQETDKHELTVRTILERADLKHPDEYQLIRDEDNHEFRNPEEEVHLHEGEGFTARKLEIYFVNGEMQEADKHELTVRTILERADLKPPEEYLLIREKDEHKFANLDEEVHLYEDERFTAIKPEREIEVIINGTSYGKLSFPESILMKKLLEESLTKTKNTGRPLDDWEMKDEDGHLIDLKKHLRDYPSLDKVFITLIAGAGGEYDIPLID